MTELGWKKDYDGPVFDDGLNHHTVTISQDEYLRLRRCAIPDGGTYVSIWDASVRRYLVVLMGWHGVPPQEVGRVVAKTNEGKDALSIVEAMNVSHDDANADPVPEEILILREAMQKIESGTYDRYDCVTIARMALGIDG